MIHLRRDQLPDAWAESTVERLADVWNQLNQEIKRLQGSRDHIGGILLEASAKDHNGAEEPWREGKLIVGETCSVFAQMVLTEGGDHPKWEWRLRYHRG